MASNPARGRVTTQALLPSRPVHAPAGSYEIYPSHALGPGRIGLGFEALAERIASTRVVTIEGFGGLDWGVIRSRLDQCFADSGVSATWIDVERALRSPGEIAALVAPSLGGDDPLFGRAFEGELGDFFDDDALSSLVPDPEADVSILYGCGAELAGWPGELVYIDLPKNEIQFRARTGAAVAIGGDRPLDPRAYYKRCYFVDWPVLNRHKRRILERIDCVVDGQREDEPSFAEGGEILRGLDELSRSVIRARPWFEPGPWGGQWMKERIPQLPQDVPNYAWSFELITPENGLLFESDGIVLEVSFDSLMYRAGPAVLGESAERFDAEFPIRFDFLDTVRGGNLSVQVHPRPEYITTHFGERFTQDETYYMLDCDEGAEVYLGFQEGTDPEEFRAALESSHREGTPLDVDRFIQRHPASKHDLFLIPHGTVHCSGEGGLVLEVSATPYIFTFKLYDWLRLDLEGRPRPLNIDRGMENAYFDRAGERIEREFISTPRVTAEGPGWRVMHLPTHDDHFYDIERAELSAPLTLSTRDSVQVMSVVEGDSVIVEVGGTRKRFAYAETFVVPASARSFRLVPDRGPASVLRAFVKPGRGPV